MDSLSVSSKINDCTFFDLDDLLAEFDGIIDSIMQTDIQRHQVRLAVADWCETVDAVIGELESLDYLHNDYQDTSLLMADVTFGTET